MSELKNCPFCGGKAVLAQQSRSVYCSVCKFTTRIFPRATRFVSGAADAWNQRTNNGAKDE